MATSPHLTLVLLSDYELVAKGLEKMLEPFDSRVRIVEPTSQPNDIPVDVALATYTADQASKADVKARHVVLYTLNEDAGVLADPRASGADSVLSTRLAPEELIDALERICAGETVVELDTNTGEAAAYGDWPGQAAGLSLREAQVVALITQGLSNQEIARTLLLSTNTIKSYIRSAYRRMNVTTRSHAILWAVDHEFARPHPDSRQPSSIPPRRLPAPKREQGEAWTSS